MEAPRSSRSAGPRSAATPAEVQAILAEVTGIRRELTAFFSCLYYAALRPAEAVALLARVGGGRFRGPGEKITMREAAERDGWLCGICPDAVG